MKRLACILAAAMAMTAFTTVFAAEAEYVQDSNKVTVDEAGAYKTVVITKGTEAFSGGIDNVVYLNQASNTFAATAEFMIVNNPEDGTYTVTLGKANGDSTTTEFEISSVTPPDPASDLAMDMLAAEESSAEGYQNLAFVTEGVNLMDYTTLKLVVDENGESPKYGGYDLNELIGATIDGPENLGLQINNIPDEYVGKITVYLSNAAIDKTEQAWSSEEGN